MSERLLALSDLSESGVASVETSAHGRLAVGVANGKPFAVSPVCRHFRADLAKGRVVGEGGLECPLHGAQFDVHTGAMTLGPQGAFKPVAGVVKGTMGRRKLDVYPVEERDGVLYLAG